MLKIIYNTLQIIYYTYLLQQLPTPLPIKLLPLNNNKANNNNIDVLFARFISFAFANKPISTSNKNSSVLFINTSITTK